jgi:hypothetical protein
MDMFSVGRILLWMASSKEHLWPNPEHQDPPRYELTATEEAALFEDVKDHSALPVIKRLTHKDPTQRMALEQLRAMSSTFG